jgi:hypothetical protein
MFTDMFVTGKLTFVFAQFQEKKVLKIENFGIKLLGVLSST